MLFTYADKVNKKKPTHLYNNCTPWSVFQDGRTSYLPMLNSPCLKKLNTTMNIQIYHSFNLATKLITHLNILHHT